MKEKQEKGKNGFIVVVVSKAQSENVSCANSHPCFLKALYLLSTPIHQKLCSTIFTLESVCENIAFSLEKLGLCVNVRRKSCIKPEFLKIPFSVDRS